MSTNDGSGGSGAHAPDPESRERIWRVVDSIPQGTVATYGQVAELAGLPGGARQVGRILAVLPPDSRLPWHRVVNAQGRISVPGPAGQRQRRLLGDEGVDLRADRVDLKRYRWMPDAANTPQRANARNRIDRVTTRSGDRGETSLADGRRYRKYHLKVHLVGALDEANSYLGLLTLELDADAGAQLCIVQSRLFDIGAAVASGDCAVDWAQQADDLAAQTAALNERLPPLREFVLPGGGRVAALAHVARTVVRRAERHWWQTIEEDEPLQRCDAGLYLNRLSDYLFVFARAHAEHERLWEPLKLRLTR